MCEHDYVCGSDLTDDDVSAYDRGELVEWRRAPTGEMWYKWLDSSQPEFPPIKAVPPQAAASASDSDVFDEPVVLTDAERDALLQWADDLRRGAGDDPEEADDADG